MLVVVSAPSYAHGVVDPVAEIAAAAAERGVRCHVDACIGGWVLPYAARLGRDVRPRRSRSPGVTSISVDLHKYGYAPKGTSVLLHRTPAAPAAVLRLRRLAGLHDAELDRAVDEVGRPAGGAWAVVRDGGRRGLRRLVPARSSRPSTGSSPASTRSRGCRVLVPAGLDARRARHRRLVRRRSPSATRWAPAAGTSSRRCPTHGRPPTIHLSVSAATRPLVADFVAALRESVVRARSRPAR